MCAADYLRAQEGYTRGMYTLERRNTELSASDYIRSIAHMHTDVLPTK